MKNHTQSREDAKAAYLDEDTGAEERAAGGEFLRGGVWVGDAGGAVGGEGADEGVQAEEGGDYAAGVEGER